MSNLSRTAVLFSTAVLGGALLTTSVTSTATVAYAAEITASNLSFDMTNSPAQPVQSPSVDERGTTGEESTHALRILQADNDEESMAASYMLDTVKISKNEDGTYYAYLTTHTPAMMGKTPIDFTDTNHGAKLLSTNLVDNYYQSVFRLTLTESEIKAPTTTSIHVEFTSPITYNENYDIRLVVGEQLSDETPTDNQNTDTSVSDNTGAISDSRTTPDANVLQDGVYKMVFTRCHLLITKLVRRLLQV